MNTESPLNSLLHPDDFIERHIGPDATDIQHMLDEIGHQTLDELVAATLPSAIALNRPLALDAPRDEQSALSRLRRLAEQNVTTRSLIGLGYYDTVTPPVIVRNVLENPGWYTAYTPYQPEISQGRLETLLAFQQMVMDLTGMALANASLLDEATAAAEAMTLAKRVSKARNTSAFFVDQNCFPQTIDVVRTRAANFGFEVIIGPAQEAVSHDVFGALLQYPDATGRVPDLAPLITALHERQAIACVAADLMALTVVTAPGSLGADVVIGSTQRFGVPMGFGGPHAAYLAARDDYRRAVPGRLIGVSIDSRGNPAYRMALQTREQHIRREKANSNICTAQVLLANISALYAMYHGPRGLRRIGLRIHRLTRILAAGLQRGGLETNSSFFDTLTIPLDPEMRTRILEQAQQQHVNLCAAYDDSVRISLDECSTATEVEHLWGLLLGDAASSLGVADVDSSLDSSAEPQGVPARLRREIDYLQHPVFNRYHSETEMLRYLKRLENRDLSLTHAMIPLGSCTMKLNATAEMIPITWPEFSKPHPFAPLHQTQGYREMICQLEQMLAEICGFDSVSMQPNSGAQGEYAGLLAIRRYLDATGQSQRRVCLIPSSAHGTNPATAHMLGMKVVVVRCDENGNVDVDDLRSKATEYSHELAALMITYPSTHGVFEESVHDICRIIHDHGGQVYMDGANLNAMVGLARPGDIGADVSHVNLHKTFCIPHGGGGPGMGPIGVKAHLAPYVSSHPVVELHGPNPGNGAVSAAPWGSASILPISWMYITMMGASGLLKASQIAILNANYIATRLAPYYPVLYTGNQGRVAHECIIDLRPIKATTGISDEDIAKRLMDYGFHAPTMSFPVPGTLMIEPTESESLAELDRFVESMISIRKEILRIENRELDADNNMLRNAPHTLADIMDDTWDRPYSKNEAAFPLDWLRHRKFWPAVNRVDNAYGDRNLFCACPPMEDYE